MSTTYAKIKYLGLAIKCSAFITLLYCVAYSILISGAEFRLWKIFKVSFIIFDKIYWMIMPVCIILYSLAISFGNKIHLWKYSIDDYAKISKKSYLLFLFIVPLALLLLICT